jgi:gliding motility-associated lipoprotein GldH
MVMLSALKKWTLCAAALVILITGGCMQQDANTLVDTNIEVADLTWPYVNKVIVNFKVDDPEAPYNMYLNLRISPDYKYSNIFVLVHITSPDHKTVTNRYEVTLAKPSGEWLGSGSGNLFNYQVLLQKQHQFKLKGVYKVAIEQNMRDNPLLQVSDVGLKVEKANNY